MAPWTPVANDHTAVPNWASTYTPSHTDGTQTDFGLAAGLPARVTGATYAALGTASASAVVTLGKAGLTSTQGNFTALAAAGKYVAPAVNASTHRYEVTLKDVEIVGQFKTTRMLTYPQVTDGSGNLINLDWSTNPTTVQVKNAKNLPDPGGSTLTAWIGTSPADTVSFTYTGVDLTKNLLTGVVGPGTGTYPSASGTDIWVTFHFVGSGNWKIIENTRAAGFTYNATTLSGNQDVNNLPGSAAASVTSADVGGAGGGTPGRVTLTALPNGTTPNGWSVQAMDGTQTTSLAADIGSTDSTMTVTNYPPAWPADPGGADLPFVSQIDAELIRIIGRSGTTLTLDRHWSQTNSNGKAHTHATTISTPTGVYLTADNFSQSRYIVCQMTAGQTAATLVTALNGSQSHMFTASSARSGVMPTFGKSAFTGGTDGYLGVTSATGFPTSGMVRISTYHAMDYTGVDTGHTPHRLTGCHFRENMGGATDTRMPPSTQVWTEADGCEVLTIPTPTFGDAGDTKGGYLMLDGCSATSGDPLQNIWQCYPSIQQPFDFRNNVNLYLKRHFLEMYCGSIGVAIQGNTIGCTIDTATWLTHPAAEEQGGTGVRHSDLCFLQGWESSASFSITKLYQPVSRSGQPQIIQSGSRAISNAIYQDCLFQLMREQGAGTGFELYSGDSNGGQNVWFDRTANLDSPKGSSNPPFTVRSGATNTVNPAAGDNANKWDVIGRTLGATCQVGDTTVTLDSASKTPTDNNVLLVVGSEQMLVTAGAGTTTLTVTRAQSGTTAALHASGTAVYWQVPPPFSDAPIISGPPNCLAQPHVVGGTIVGSVLSSDMGSWDDSSATLAIQWNVSTDNVSYMNVVGATGLSYVIPAVGQYLRVTVTATNSFGSTSVTSDNVIGPSTAGISNAGLYRLRRAVS